MCLICEEEEENVDDDGKAISPTTDDDGMVQCCKVLRRRRPLSVRLEVCASVITGVRYTGDGPNELPEKNVYSCT